MPRIFFLLDTWRNYYLNRGVQRRETEIAKIVSVISGISRDLSGSAGTARLNAVIVGYIGNRIKYRTVMSHRRQGGSFERGREVV